MAPISPDSLVLVTGANGFLASHICNTLLAHSHKVHGTVRSEAKGIWLQTLFDKTHGPNRFTFVIVSDLAVPGAVKEAIKGCDAVAHVASDLSFSSDPNIIIPGVVNGVRNILETAAEAPSIKRFVLTSSSTAATHPIPNKKFVVIADSWNDDAVTAAWAPPPYTKRAWDVYAASKTQSERELWKFVKERKNEGRELHFDVNTVLPNANFGPLLNLKEQKDNSTAGWITALWGKETMPEELEAIPPQHFISVLDTALLHLAALTLPSLTSTRIFGFAAPFTWNMILHTLRKIHSHVTFPKDIDDQREDLSVIEEAEKAERILRDMKGGEGWTGLEECLRGNTEGLAEL